MEGKISNFIHENKTKAGFSPAGSIARSLLSLSKGMETASYDPRHTWLGAYLEKKGIPLGGVGFLSKERTAGGREGRRKYREQKLEKRLELIGYDVKFKEQIDREIEHKQDEIEILKGDVEIKKENYNSLQKFTDGAQKDFDKIGKEVNRLRILKIEVGIKGVQADIDDVNTLLVEAEQDRDEKQEALRVAKEESELSRIDYEDTRAKIRGLETGYVPKIDANGVVERDARGNIITYPPFVIGDSNPMNNNLPLTRDDIVQFSGIETLKKMSVQVKTAQMKEYLLNESQSNYNIPNDPRYIKRNAVGDIVSFHVDQKAELRTANNKMMMALGGAVRHGTAAFIGGTVASGGNPLVGVLTALFAAVYRGSKEFSKTGEIKDLPMEAIANVEHKMR